MSRILKVVSLLGFLCAAAGDMAVGQQVQVTTPSIGVNESFFERIGMDWGFHLRGPSGYLFFNRGGSNGAIPPFGGFNPASQAGFGFATRGGNGGFYFNLQAAQGSRRSVVSSAPSVVMPNGGVGVVRDLTVRPFVTGLIPVVGDVWISPLRERIARLRTAVSRDSSSPRTAGSAEDATPEENDATAVSRRTDASPRTQRFVSTAEYGDISLAEIRRQQRSVNEQEGDSRLIQLIEEANAAERARRFGAARVRYRRAAAEATGEQKKKILEKLKQIADE